MASYISVKRLGARRKAIERIRRCPFDLPEELFKKEYRINQSSFLFLKKKKKVPSNTFTERETQEKEETTQRQSVKTCDMKIVVHTHKKKKTTRMVVTPKKKRGKRESLAE